MEIKVQALRSPPPKSNDITSPKDGGNLGQPLMTPKSNDGISSKGGTVEQPLTSTNGNMSGLSINP